MPSSRAPDLPPGALFAGRYQIVRSLGGGSQGRVYEVQPLTGTGPRRALKILAPIAAHDDTLRERFRLEASLVSRVRSGYFPEVHEAGIDPQFRAPYLVMERLEGEDLAALLDREKRMSPRAALSTLAELARALTVLHRAGLVHRDLKPENLFLSRAPVTTAAPQTGVPRAQSLKILDFGVAKVVVPPGATPAETGALGTPLYMSPEALRGDGRIGVTADLYSLAHIAYVLLTGGPYWFDGVEGEGSLMQLLPQLLVGPVEPTSVRAARRSIALPAAFDTWFARATAADPQSRFSDAATQISALASALSLPDPMSVSTHQRARWLAAFGAAVAVLVVGAWMFKRVERSPEPASVSSPSAHISTSRSPAPDACDVHEGEAYRFRGLSYADILRRAARGGWVCQDAVVSEDGGSLTMGHPDHGSVTVFFLRNQDNVEPIPNVVQLRDAKRAVMLVEPTHATSEDAATRFEETLRPYPAP
ncbi:MAG: serine/threonine-protein kinase [Polyangiaceae bacterium]